MGGGREPGAGEGGRCVCAGIVGVREFIGSVQSRPVRQTGSVWVGKGWCVEVGVEGKVRVEGKGH